MVGPRNPTDFFFMVLVGLISVSVLVGYLEHLADRDRWLSIELSTKLIMMIEPIDKIGNYFGFMYVRNLVPYF